MKIVSDLPIPERGRKTKYDYQMVDSMNVGDCIIKNGRNKKELNSFRVALIRRYKDQMQFSCRFHDTQTIYIWRIK